MNPQKTQTTEELLDDLAALLSEQSAERRELAFSDADHDPDQEDPDGD